MSLFQRPVSGLATELDILHDFLLHVSRLLKNSAHALQDFLRRNVLKIDLCFSTSRFQLGIFKHLRKRFSEERDAIRWRTRSSGKRPADRKRSCLDSHQCLSHWVGG